MVKNAAKTHFLFARAENFVIVSRWGGGFGQPLSPPRLGRPGQQSPTSRAGAGWAQLTDYSVCRATELNPWTLFYSLTFTPINHAIHSFDGAFSLYLLLFFILLLRTPIYHALHSFVGAYIPIFSSLQLLYHLLPWFVSCPCICCSLTPHSAHIPSLTFRRDLLYHLIRQGDSAYPEVNQSNQIGN